MQKLLLELGGPLVIAVVLLGIARMVRDVVERLRGAPTEEKNTAETQSTQSTQRSAEKDEER